MAAIATVTSAHDNGAMGRAAVVQKFQLDTDMASMANKPDALCRHCGEWIVRANTKTPWVHVGTMSESCGTYADPDPPENIQRGRHTRPTSSRNPGHGRRKLT